MTYHGRFGANGVCRFRKPFSRAVRCTVEAEGDFSLCHLRDGSGDYLATIERDGRIRESLVFNVYKGAVRAGTMAASRRLTEGKYVLPAVSLSWGKRSFDGRALTAPIWESAPSRRRTLAEIRKTRAGWRIRMADGAGAGDECDALLTMAAGEMWLRATYEYGGGAL